jgi:hypothetical protein
VTLRRIALGIAGREQLRTADLTRLIHLLLVEEVDGRLALTDTGRQRYRLLPKATDMGDIADTREFVAVLKRRLRQDKR